MKDRIHASALSERGVLVTTTTHSVVIERNLDHERTCQFCGKPFMVVFRVYGVGEGVTFTKNHKKAQDTAASDAAADLERRLLETDQKSFRHRCTHCGKYPKACLDKMRESYEEYRESQLRKVVGKSIFFGILYIIFASCIVGGISAAGLRFHPFVVFLFLSIPALVLTGIWAKHHPQSHTKAMQMIDAYNGEDVVNLWLEHWAKHGEAAIRAVAPSDVRYWERLITIQHKYDPPNNVGSTP